MCQNKMNGSAPSLDARIAATLASDVADKATLTVLVAKAHDALAEAQAVIEGETPRLHDLSNENLDASLPLINRSKLRVERLEKAIPKLRDRIRSIELYEYRQALNEHFDYHEKVRDSLAAELPDLYLGFLAQITDLYARIDKNAAAISDLHARAAAIGEDRRLLDAELVARGLDHFDAQHSRLRETLKLPQWDRSAEVAFPPNMLDEWNRRAVQMNEAHRQRMTAKGALVSGDNWHAGRDLAVEQETAEFRKRDAELKKQELERKAAYEDGLKQGRYGCGTTARIK